MRARFIFAALLVFITGCSVNPVTGKSELIFVSEAEEIQLGQQNYVPTQQSQGGVYDVDPELAAYVQGVGNRLSQHAARDLPYEFVVLNNSVPNAWALPGGKIAINRGLLTELNSEAELAAVLGHEIVHADARHSAQQMTRGLLTQVLVVATSVATSDSDYGDLAVGGAAIGAQLITTRYGRQAELESDLYGMQYMSAAGYDPQGAVALQETFVRLSEGRRTDWLSGLFASHPPSMERVEANRQTASISEKLDALMLREKQVDVDVSHPSHSGMQMDQISLLFIPMRYVENLEVDLDGAGYVDITGSISLSENPRISMSVPRRTHSVDVTMTDTDGTVSHAHKTIEAH